MLLCIIIVGAWILSTAITPAGAPGSDFPDIEDENIRDAFRELYDKNPEARDYIAAFNGVTDTPEKVDLSDDLTPGEVPLLMQWDERWGYCRYGSGLVGYTGCGPTCLSMVMLGLTGDETYNPGYVAAWAEENGYAVPGNGTAWTLFSEGAEKLGLTPTELPLHEETMKQELDAGKPIILIMGPGDFTTTGHFIVITGYTEEGFTVLDPNRRSNSEKPWQYDDIKDQIKNIWSYSA